MINQEYNIDLIPSGEPLVVNVSQFDRNSRTLIFNLYNDNVVYQVPEGISVNIQGTKPDKTGFSYAMEIDGNQVSINLKEQMAAVSGNVCCEISLISQQGQILGSANFILQVEQAALDSDAVISESDIPIFEQLVAQASTYVGQARGYSESALQSANNASQSAVEAEESAESIRNLVPTTGNVGQVLTKTATGASWQDSTGGTWGSITGNISDQTDLQAILSNIDVELSTKGNVKTVNNVSPDSQGNVDIVALPSGGTQGQYLIKQSAATGDASWDDATFGGITKQVTLTQASWNNSQYVITDSLITASSVQLIGIDSSATDSQREAYANAQIFADDSQQTVGSLVLVAKGDVPSLDIPIKILYQTQVAPITQVDINSIYPIGSIYMSVNNVNPSNLFGGTWTQLKDRFLLGAGDTYTAGATGGEAENTLTTNELPSGVLGVNSTNSDFLKELNGMSAGSGFGWLGRNHTSTPEPVNNMPPYLVVYMWQRTA